LLPEIISVNSVVPTARGKPVLMANMLNDIANLSVEQEDNFSSDCEDDSEDNFCEWDIKSGLCVLQMINVAQVTNIVILHAWKPL
jgi:hypothetical protein